ncbi:MAG: NADH-quinone oxidoreductase subunit L [Capsulimonadaceae bacterium]
MPSIDYDLAKWVPFLALIGFLINSGCLGFRPPKPVSGWLATICVFGGFAISYMMLINVLGAASGAKQHVVYLAHWLVVPGTHGLEVNYEFLIDPLSVTMMLIVTGVGGLIHLYSIGYMAADKDFTRFFTYLNLFIFFMLLLVMGNNLLILFIGWEGVGLCSYLLIGYFYEKQSAGDAAKKAFIMNRIGDVGVLIGMFMIFQYFGTLDFVTGHAGFKGITDPDNIQNMTGGGIVVTTICLMLFLGATGKSAQIPLYPWLPDAMEGPTPVSALIHAATMVTAGVYMVCRTHTLFEQSPVAMEWVCGIGIVTAIVAATIGLAQNDIKRVLAYSTVSQLGYMFAACGAGVFAAGMFHVMTHAFFKACLFLCSGSVIHAVEHGMHAKEHSSDEHGTQADEGNGAAGHALVEPVGILAPDPHDPQDMRNMGGLFGKIPVTAWCMLLATLAIAGIFPFAGFWSKDQILWSLYNSHSPQFSGRLVWLIGSITALLTAFYMFRMIMKTFRGAPRSEGAAHAHESPAVMVIPLVILAALSIVTGWPQTLSFEKFQDFLAPSVVTPGFAPRPMHPGLEGPLGWGVMVAILFVIGYCVARYTAAKNNELLSTATRVHNGLYRAVYYKYYVDEFNNNTWVRGGKALATWLWKAWDVDLIDGIVNGVGTFTAFAGSLLRRFQTGYVRNYAFSMVVGILFVLIACLIQQQR